MFLPHWRSGPLTAEVYHSPTGGPVTLGMLAEYVTLDQDLVEAVPQTLNAVHGTGGVALFALQFAAALGAQEILDWTDGRGADHVVETVGGANLNQSLRAVRIGGSIAFIGLIGGVSAQVNTYDFVTRNLELHGIETGTAPARRRWALRQDRSGRRQLVPVG